MQVSPQSFSIDCVFVLSRFSKDTMVAAAVAKLKKDDALDADEGAEMEADEPFEGEEEEPREIDDALEG